MSKKKTTTDKVIVLLGMVTLFSFIGLVAYFVTPWILLLLVFMKLQITDGE